MEEEERPQRHATWTGTRQSILLITSPNRVATLVNASPGADKLPSCFAKLSQELEIVK